MYNKRGRKPKSSSRWGWYDKPAKKPIPEGTGNQALKCFQKVTQRFFLRRLKTDKSIISDLPDKVEQNQFCTLSPKQALNREFWNNAKSKR